LHRDDHLNHHATANLRDDGPYLDQMRGEKKDGWMGAMSYREAFFHPFRTPLFKFSLMRYELYVK
jgi:hypothetical protein